MKSLRFILAVAVFAFLGAAGANPPTKPANLVTGGKAYNLPEWFKPSFLDFPDDVKEARQKGKGVLIFFHLDACPYCARVLEENFVKGENKDFIQKNFDVVAVNVRGDKDVTWIDRATYTEKSLTKKLRIYGTPGMVLIDVDGTLALQINGYRDPNAMRLALRYVQEKHYRTKTLIEYTNDTNKAAVYTLRSHPSFVTLTNFKGFKKPLAVIFENKGCADCPAFHDKLLNHPESKPELAKFTVVRLDTDAATPITDINGNVTTANRWANALGLSYRPGVILFDDGKEAARMDNRFYHYHFKELLRYVSGGYYKRFDGFFAYTAMRRDEMAKEGKVIDYSE
jgi:thioredoxin-related protein